MANSAPKVISMATCARTRTTFTVSPVADELVDHRLPAWEGCSSSWIDQRA
jgi:hypothetical protein